MLGSQQLQTWASAPVRGIHRLWDPRVWGTIVGATGATVFVLPVEQGYNIRTGELDVN